MANAKKLQERVALPRTAWIFADFLILFLLVALLSRRAASLREEHGPISTSTSTTWLPALALACEAWFTFVWLLNMNGKWSPVRFDTYPENLPDEQELPAVDMFVTTADPALEPPVITANTVLSLLAVDYPDAGGKLACYVSDDGCSPVTCYALREAAEFAAIWVPFCRKHGVAVRAPFMYFSSAPEVAKGHEFLERYSFMKSEYEKLVTRIENADERSILRDGEFAEFIDAERRNHPTIVKVLWDNSKSKAGEGFPHLVYVSREKSPEHYHNFKAGAMNVLTRVSGVMTNSPIMLNVDCDMFANNPQVVLHAMCLLLGFADETQSGFVQAPQKFYGGLKDDPFGNQMEVIYKKVGGGVAGIQGLFYGGTGCFHRRKVIYGVPPPDVVVKHEITGSPSYKELQTKFGSSKELIESSRDIISGDVLLARATESISSRVEVAKQVGACSYEAGTCWGQEIGWVYGSMTEDILTGQRIHATGWNSALLDTTPPAFLGCAPTGGPASLTQFKRWATGLLEILISRNSPILGAIFRRLQLRQCLAYLIIHVWPVRAPFELCYALLGPFCLLTNHSFLPKVSDEGFRIPLALFLAYNVYNLMEYKECGLSARAWWNNHRMQRITSASAWLLAFLTVLLKTVGLSETVFEVTRKESSSTTDGGGASTDEADPGLFTFDSSPVFVPATALSILNVVAIAVGAWRALAGTATGVRGGPGMGEFVCCGWMVLCLWPFVRGLVSRGRYGIPWSVRVKAGLIVSVFVHLCTRN